MKPYIHLFRTAAHHYFYDVNRNESIRIEEATYHYLKSLNHDEGKDNHVIPKTSEAEALLKQGYLSNNRVKEIEHPDSWILEDYIHRKMKMLVIQITQNCNLSCAYCPYVVGEKEYRKHSNKKISLEMAEKALIMLRESSVDCDEVSIAFYGGEPLLEFDLMKKIVASSQRLLSKSVIRYSLTTNATLLTDEMIEFFSIYNVNLTISLDGPKAINDKNRKFRVGSKSVFDVVIDKIKLIENKYEYYLSYISLNMVIDPTQDFYEYKAFFNNYPVLNKILVMPTLVEDYSTDQTYKEFADFGMKSEHSKFLTYLNQMNMIKLEDTSFYETFFGPSITKVKEDWPKLNTLGEKFCPSGPCTPGEKKIMIDVDGNLYPCERLNENYIPHRMGHIESGIDISTSYKILNIAQSNQDRCKNCFAFRHCSLCIKGHEDTIRFPNEINPKCKKVRSDFYHLLRSRAILKEVEELEYI
jgi:uncharacterized protein